MRSAVQSCVPLQESTANSCVFFVYSHQALPPKGLDIDVSGAESLLSKCQKRQWTEVSEANEGLMASQMKTSQGLLKQLSWVQCDRTERIRRSRSRRLKHPASRYLKIKHLRNFRECFFISREHRVNTKSIYFI